MSLGRFWRDRGRIVEARQLLDRVNCRFTEGFAAADLLSARDLLRQLA
jgi:hypothetical protein